MSWLDEILQNAREAVLKWPAWKRSDYVLREFPEAYAEKPARVHCWKSAMEHAEETGTTWDGPESTCMLDDGHEVPHDFVPDDEIVVVLVES